MNVVFCLSNLFIPYCIEIIRLNPDRNFVIYTYENNINDFFLQLYSSNTFVSVYFREGDVRHRNFVNFFRIKKDVLQFLLNLKIDNVYFFHNSFANFENYLIKKLSRKSNIFYCPVFSNINFTFKFNFKTVKDILITYLLYGIPVKSVWSGAGYVTIVKNSFFASINSTQLNIEIDQNYIKFIIEYSFNLPKSSDILLLTGSMVELNQIEEKEYIDKINKLINSVDKTRISVKPHPRFPSRFGLENNLNLIPSYIPANVLFSKFSIFIGYSTCVVAEAMDAGLLGISLLEYFHPTSIHRKNVYKKYLQDNCKSGDIYFPSSVDELKKLI